MPRSATRRVVQVFVASVIFVSALGTIVIVGVTP